MKLLCLVFKRIKCLFFVEKTISVIFFISLFTTCVALLYFYGYYNNIREDKENYNIETRRYIIDVKDETKAVDIANTVKNQTFFNVDELILNSSQKDSEDKHFSIVSYYPSNHNSGIIQGRYFNKNELTALVDNIVIGKYLVKINTMIKVIGMQYELNGKSYKIVGVDDYLGSNAIEMPYLTFIKHSYKLDNITFIKNNDTKDKQINEFSKFLSLHYPDAHITKPPKANYGTLIDFLSRMISILVIITLGIVNFLQLFKYLVEKRSHEYAVMKICGANNIKMIFIMLIELFTLTGISYILSLIVVIGVKKYISGYLSISLSYSFSDYLIVYAIVNTIATISFLGTINKAMVYSPIQAKRLFME